MHAAAAASRRSLWAGLDALVLEEIEALRTLPPPPPPRAPNLPVADFASDDEFLMRTLRYLADHRDPATLVASLSAGFPPAPRSELQGPAAADEEPPAAPAAGEEAADASGGPAAGAERQEEERP